MKILFFDIDGVLNTHLPAGCDQGLHFSKVFQLSRIVGVIGCKLVLSSAWRYMGWGYGSVWQQCLRGLDQQEVTQPIVEAMIGATPLESTPEDRDVTIRRWLKEHGTPASWCAVDDLEHVLRLAPNAVRTLPHEGLTHTKASEVIDILGVQT